ncbi:MAG TPA: purine-nucleoside phosphorylase, partial [Anaerolineae bacterium]|nr:purine-nucleoside phosphorylase [Anaerolineae bacterium]
MNTFTYAQYEEAAQMIRGQISAEPTIGLVLGSGLSSLADAIPDPTIIDYGDIPHWPQSTVEGHSGRLVIGNLQGKSVLIMQGRVHTYEGYSAHAVTFPIRVMKLLGIETVILTNAAGGINPAFHVGDLMLITDHINWVGMAGLNPLKGPNLKEFGLRFPDMTFAYSPELQKIAHAAAKATGVDLRQGVYTWLSGPNFETPAEIRMHYRLGSDAIGMSTVPSVVVARHCGMR